MLMRPMYSDGPAQRWHDGEWLLDSSAMGRTVLCPPTELARYLIK
jgi:hypothetical protein